MPHYVFERDDDGFRMARHDGSIRDVNQQRCYNCGEGLYFCECGDYADNYDESGYYNFVGEVASRPMTTFKELREFHDEFAHVEYNHHCGMHVHLSLSYIDYLNLVWHYDKLRKDFNNFFSYYGESRSIGKSHQYYKRQITGIYCKPKLTLDDVRQQLTNESYHSSRYRNINFCWTKHHTIEFRHLPMFRDVHLRVDSTIALIDFLDNWLEQHPMKKKQVEVMV